MKMFEIRYISNEGNNRWMEFEASDDADEDSVRNDVMSECGYADDDINMIISISRI